MKKKEIESKTNGVNELESLARSVSRMLNTIEEARECLREIATGTQHPKRLAQKTIYRITEQLDTLN